MTILTNAACTRVKPGPTITRLAFCFIPIANYSLLSSINQGTFWIKAKFILYENTLHKIVFTIFRDTNYVFRWIFILFKCSRSFVDFIYIWDTKLVINLCKKLMNDNLYQSKAGVFTAGWFLWPAITIPSSRQIRIMMMHCNCRMETCTSLQWRFSSMPHHWCPEILRYVRQVTLFIFSFSSKHSALGYQISELLTNQYCLPQWPSSLDGKISS